MSNTLEELEIVPKRFLNKFVRVPKEKKDIKPQIQCDWCRKNNISYLPDVDGYPVILVKELMKHLQMDQDNKRTTKPFDVSILDKFNGKKKRN